MTSKGGAELIKRTINIDFSHRLGKIKPVNCLNNGPFFGIDMRYDFSEQYREMSPPYVRVSDVEAPYASSRYLDIHCIFPDMALDERFELSYNFGPTDEYLAAVKETGAEIFLRLGESSEPYEVKKYTRTPADIQKTARICERIIAHYNKGWAKGFKYNIKYVEIMASPDVPTGWASSRKEYFELYSVIANHIKERFPKIRVGAYSSGGFFSLNHYDASPLEKSYIPFLEDFLSYISRIKKAPLDFLSWKCYAESEEEINLHANYAASYLSQYGFKRAESIISEFNLRDTKQKRSFLEKSYPARLARSLILAEKSNVDMMFYYHLDPLSEWNGLYALEDRTGKRIYAPYHVMKAFGTLSRLGNVVDSREDYRRELYTLAAADDNSGACFFATADYSGPVEIVITGKEYTKYSLKGIIGGGDRGAGFFIDQQGLPLRDGTVSFKVGRDQVYLLTFS